MNSSLAPRCQRMPAPIRCQYQNATSSVQVVRISNIKEWFFERTVFPGQMLFFEAPASAVLEVQTGLLATTITADSIPCHRLKAIAACNPPSSEAA